MFCVYLRTNSNFRPMYIIWLVFITDMKCLLRGMNWVFKYSSLRLVCKVLKGWGRRKLRSLFGEEITRRIVVHLIVSMGLDFREIPLFQKALIHIYLGHKPLVFNTLLFVADSVISAFLPHGEIGIETFWPLQKGPIRCPGSSVTYQIISQYRRHVGTATS